MSPQTTKDPNKEEPIEQSLLDDFKSPDSPGSLFISFEGIEGSGKTTQILKLKEHLEANGLNVSSFREPGGTPFGEKLRSAILQSEEKLAPMAEACLFASSRSQLLESRILPALETPRSIVIVDRYLDSSLAYQGVARSLGIRSILDLHRRSPLTTVPHLSFYIKIDTKTSWERQAERGDKKDYFEKEKNEFYEKLISGYDRAAQLFSKRFCVLDGLKAPEALAQEIAKRVDQELN